MGLVAAHPFKIEYTGGDHLDTKPIYYPPPQRQWIKQHVAGLISTEVFRPAQKPRHLSPVVLVP